MDKLDLRDIIENKYNRSVHSWLKQQLCRQDGDVLDAPCTMLRFELEGTTYLAQFTDIEFVESTHRLYPPKKEPRRKVFLFDLFRHKGISESQAQRGDIVNASNLGEALNDFALWRGIYTKECEYESVPSSVEEGKDAYHPIWTASMWCTLDAKDVKAKHIAAVLFRIENDTHDLRGVGSKDNPFDPKEIIACRTEKT